jgi:hypothetical protein
MDLGEIETKNSVCLDCLPKIFAKFWGNHSKNWGNPKNEKSAKSKLKKVWFYNFFI